MTWLIEHVKDKILPKQFAWLTGNFYNELSIDMIQTWLSYLDPSGQHLRLLDFSKVLDRIGHNILIEKLLDLGVHTSLIPWITSFLTTRRQRVRYLTRSLIGFQLKPVFPKEQNSAQCCFW